MKSLHDVFDRFANKISKHAGNPTAFCAAVGVLVIWALTGPLLGFSNTWQLIINTGTTIVTFLMVFLIQHTQNKDSKAVQMKLDELIAVTEAASNRLLRLEDMTDDEMEEIHRRFERLARDAAGSNSGSSGARGSRKR
jgi:low affinity Fe/Cu permease